MKFSQISDFLIKRSSSPLRFIFLMLGGVLTGLTLVFTKIGFIEWITLIPMALVLLVRASDRGVKLRSLYLDGFVFYYSYYLVCYHWFIYLYPLEFIDGMTKGAALAVVLLAWLGLSLLQALMGGVVFVMCGALFRCHLCERFPLLRVFVAAGAFAVFEWFQTIGWWGVPWGRLPLGQAEYLVGLQTASLFGSYFVTFLILAVNLLLAYVLISPDKLKIGCITAASLLVFQYGVGTLLWFTTDVTAGEEIKVSCIQGNISSSEKWDADSNTRTKETYRKLIIEAAEEGAKLIILPETAYPYDMDSPDQTLLEEEFCNIARNYEVYLLVGAFTVEGEKDSLNSIICYTPEGKRADNVYSKRHLVPFGEYVPMKEVIMTLIPPLAEVSALDEELTPGYETALFETEWGKLGGLICFDSIYEELTRASAKDGANLMMLPSNDSWWFNTSVETYQNETQAMLRAIESGRYLVRAGNTGISSIITEHGEHKAWLAPETKGIAMSEVEMCTKTTLYTRIGNLFVYLCIAFVLLLYPLDFIIKKHKKKDML